MLRDPVRDSEFEASSLSLYIGIPTQGFRSVQAEISSLVGQILTVGHKCSNTPRGRPQYYPLVQGASSYISVFGYWMGGEMASRRVDDHTEVIEFLFPPEDLGAITALVLGEVVFPAMFAARQDEVLATVNYEGMLYRISAIRTSPQRHLTRTTRGARPLRQLAPYDMIDHLLDVCLSGWLGAGRSVGGTGKGTAVTPLFDEMLTSFREWCKSEWRPPAPGITEDTLRLPTIRHRLLTVAATWWLLYDLGPYDPEWERWDYPPPTRGGPLTLPRRDPVVEGSQPAREFELPEVGSRTESENSLFQKFKEYLKTSGKSVQGVPGYLLLSLIDEELERTLDQWDRKKWFEPGKPGSQLYGADPLANSLLWLAYTGDWLAYYLAEDRQSPFRDGRRGFSPMPSDRFGWILAKVAPAEATTPAAQRNTRERWDFWTQRLDLLAQVNDANYPDQPLLTAWRLVARLLPDPWNRTTARKQRRPRGRILKADGTVNLDWWTDIARLWGVATPAARMWLSPLMLDRIHSAIVGDKHLRNAYNSFLRRFKRGRAHGPAWSSVGLLRHFRNFDGEPLGIDSFAALIDSVRFGYPVSGDPPEGLKSDDPLVFIDIVQGK